MKLQPQKQSPALRKGRSLQLPARSKLNRLLQPRAILLATLLARAVLAPRVNQVEMKVEQAETREDPGTLALLAGHAVALSARWGQKKSAGQGEAC